MIPTGGLMMSQNIVEHEHWSREILFTFFHNQKWNVHNNQIKHTVVQNQKIKCANLIKGTVKPLCNILHKQQDSKHSQPTAEQELIVITAQTAT